jgi:hypothetical protein
MLPLSRSIFYYIKIIVDVGDTPDCSVVGSTGIELMPNGCFVLTLRAPVHAVRVAWFLDHVVSHSRNKLSSETIHEHI